MANLEHLVALGQHHLDRRPPHCLLSSMKRHSSHIALTRLLGPCPTFDALIRHQPQANATQHSGDACGGLVALPEVNVIATLVDKIEPGRKKRKRNNLSHALPF